MKKVISVLLSLIMMICILSGCIGTKAQLDIYFKDAQSNTIKAEKRKINLKENASLEDKAKIAVAELIKGPVNDTNIAVIDKDAKLLSLKVNDGVATVNMSSHYLRRKGVEELVLRFSLVNTLCSIEGIDGIVIQVEGSPIVSEKTGKEIGVISVNDIVLDTQEETQKEKRAITLYFPETDGSALKEEKRIVEIQNALSLEKTVVAELIKGPSTKETAASIPVGTKLLGIETKGSVCFVNFSEEFVSKANTGSMATTMTLYSVVNSLCALEAVSSVQILINGETGVEYGNFVLDIPYEANDDLIK